MGIFTLADAETLLAEVFAPWVQALGLRPVTLGTGAAKFLLPGNPELALRTGDIEADNSGVICGQAIAAAADTAVVLALSGANGRFRKCTTVDLSLNYLRPLPVADTDVAVEIVSNGRKLAVARVVLSTAGTAKPAALGTATFLYLED
ncbi:MAG: acyl-CoA thioesterase domain-containing protein [Pseudomonadota bacterium]